MPALRSRDQQAPLEHRLRQFLDKERHTVGLGDDLRQHLGGQRPAGDMLGQGLDLGGARRSSAMLVTCERLVQVPRIPAGR